MRIGKFFITQELASDKAKLAALTEFISTSVVIFEKIVALDEKSKQVIWMIGLCNKFADCNDNIRKIPEYDFVFEKSLILNEAGDVSVDVRQK